MEMNPRKVDQNELQTLIEAYYKNTHRGYGLMIYREVGFGISRLIQESINSLNIPNHFIDVTMLSISHLIGAKSNILEGIVSKKFENGGIIVFDSFDGATNEILRKLFIFLDKAPRNILFLFTVRKGGIYLPSYFLNRVTHVEYEMVLTGEIKERIEQFKKFTIEG